MISQGECIDQLENEGGDVAKGVAKKRHGTLKVLHICSVLLCLASVLKKVMPFSAEHPKRVSPCPGEKVLLTASHCCRSKAHFFLSLKSLPKQSL